jgi:hypothetical protein
LRAKHPSTQWVYRFVALSFCLISLKVHNCSLPLVLFSENSPRRN